MMRPRSIRRLFSLRVKSVDDIPWGLTSRSRRDLLYHFVGIQPNEGVGREGMSGAIIGMHMHDKTSTTTHTKTDNSTPEQSRQEQVHSRGQEGRIRRRWPRARRRAHHDLRCLCRGTAEAHTSSPPFTAEAPSRGGEEVRNTGRALTWCEAYRDMSYRRRSGRPFVACALAWPHSP